MIPALLIYLALVALAWSAIGVWFIWTREPQEVGAIYLVTSDVRRLVRHNHSEFSYKPGVLTEALVYDAMFYPL